MNIEYTAVSYQLVDGKWVPQLRERAFYGDRIEERTLAWEGNKFSHKEDADAFVKIKIKNIKEERAGRSKK